MPQASSEGPSGPDSLIHKLPLGSGPCRHQEQLVGRSSSCLQPPSPHSLTRFSFPLWPPLGVKASLHFSGKGSNTAPGRHPFSTRAMPSGPSQPLPPRSPQALTLPKQAWVASSIFQKVLPIFVFQTPSLQALALSPTCPSLLCPILLKTAIWQRAPMPPTHFLGHLPSFLITGTQTTLCVIAPSNVHLGSFPARLRHLCLPETRAMESCLSCR